MVKVRRLMYKTDIFEARCIPLGAAFFPAFFPFSPGIRQKNHRIALFPSARTGLRAHVLWMGPTPSRWKKTHGPGGRG